MARELYITENNTQGTITTENTVTVGYDYQKKIYYIVNKEYTTERLYAEDVYKTIQAIAPNITHITSPLLSIDEDTTELPLYYIQALSTTYEGIKKDVEGHVIYIPPIYFTWADNGSYIASIQISTYENSCLVLNAEKRKLYIDNTDIIFDLSLNENDDLRVDYIRDFYYNTIGLDLPYNFIGCLYNTLLSYYNPFIYHYKTEDKYVGIPEDKPYPHNIIDESTVEEGEDISNIKFSNLYALTDFPKTNPIAYTCAENPNKVVLDYNTLNTISSLEENRITLTNSPDPTIQVGSTFNLSHTTTVIDTSTYTSDGDYTITEIDTTNNILYTDTDFPYNYTYNPPILAIRGYEQTISSINRGTREITLSANVSNGYQVGDTIHVYGTTTTGTYGETISADGDYTISNIGINASGENAPTIIIVAEEIPANASTGSIYKDIKAGDIKEVDTETTTITLQDLTLNPSYLTDNTNYAIIYTEGDEELRVRVAQNGNYNSEDKSLQYKTPSATLKDFTYTYAELNEIVYSEETQINIDNSANTVTLPTGLFMVDTRQEVIDYIKLLGNQSTEAIPTDTNFELLGRPITEKEVYFEYPNPHYNQPEQTQEGVDEQEYIKCVMELKGLYSKVFKEDK